MCDALIQFHIRVARQVRSEPPLPVQAFSNLFCFSKSFSLCSLPKSGEHANFLFILGDLIVPASYYCNRETAYFANILRVDVLGPSLNGITFLGDPAFFLSLPVDKNAI